MKVFLAMYIDLTLILYTDVYGLSQSIKNDGTQVDSKRPQARLYSTSSNLFKI